ncbi:glycosyltransferase family 2 protein [Bacteroidales bacterium MB20-C3-3]|nr:glycosyltransferase family 2 protein [Bacteroidales bacterium MB20-C3-3]
MMIEIIFWILLIIVFYTYIGYGIVLFILVKIKELFIVKNQNIRVSEEFPDVTLLIAAYNEEAVITKKMKNSHELSYPEGRLKIVWITDGSNDGTNKLLNDYKDVKILFEPERKGKTAALNRAISFIDTPFVVFSDANTMLNKDALLNLIKPFENDSIGCVAGEKRIAAEGRDIASSSGESFYWKYESFLKDLDSRLYSSMGAAGELYAIRTELYKTIPSSILLDDFILSMLIVEGGYKIYYCKDAYAVEKGALNMVEEEKRKIRIAAGGIQSFKLLKNLLNPIAHPRTWLQFISHRVLRWTVTPIALFCLLPVNISLSLVDNSSIYDYLLLMQLVIYFFALIGKFNQDRKVKIKIFFIPYYFIFMNFCVVKGFVYLMKNRGKGTWEKSERKG